MQQWEDDGGGGGRRRIARTDGSGQTKMDERWRRRGNAKKIRAERKRETEAGWRKIIRERLRVERERESVQSLLIYSSFPSPCSNYPSIYPSFFSLSLSIYTFLPLPLPSSTFLLPPGVRREKRLPILRRGQDRDFNQLARGFSDPGND